MVIGIISYIAGVTTTLIIMAFCKAGRDNWDE